MSFGEYAPYIMASYAVVVVVLGALLAWLFIDGSHHERRLAELEARGVRRRAASEGDAS